MQIKMDEDVKKVIEFMSHEIVSDKRVAVAKAINGLALPLWGHHPCESVVPLSIEAEPISMVCGE